MAKTDLTMTRTIRTDVSLQTLNTFGVAARAARFLEVNSAVALQRYLPLDEPFRLVLGGGSNILLTGDVPGLVLYNRIRGLEVVESDRRTVVVAAGSGENWHAFVQWCLQHDFGGVENLSLIPGTVGAAPIQNIGAYGVELRDRFERLEAVELATGRRRTFSAADCRFGYRDSVFKRELKNKYFITRVLLRLSRSSHHALHLEYGAIRRVLAEMSIEHPTIQDVGAAVVRIRRAKLPDPAQLGNAGSFFKNPVIDLRTFEALKERFPDIVFYPAGEGRVKVPAGWLIERCGWKGRRIGRVGCYEKQALVLVNYGGATGEEIAGLARRIGESVEATFGIRLETEVNIL